MLAIEGVCYARFRFNDHPVHYRSSPHVWKAVPGPDPRMWCRKCGHAYRCSSTGTAHSCYLCCAGPPDCVNPHSARQRH